MEKINKYFIIFILLLFPILSVKAEQIPIVSSKNIIMYNLNDNKVIYEKSADEKVNIASLTKIMTAIVAIENIRDFDEKVLITGKMLENLSYDLSKAGFKQGEIVTYNDLLYGVLLKSGADATNILAISISGSIEEFVKLMNNKAKELEMNNSSFSNTIGIEGDNHYSSARDISKLLKYAIKNKKFMEVFKTKNYISTNKEHEMNGPLKYLTSKEEMNMNYIKGAKTGYTSKAGLCLASIASYNNVNYLLVTIGANYENKKQHMEDSKNIYEYFFNNYEYKKIISKNDKIVTLETVYGKKYEIKSEETYKSYLNKSVEKSDLIYEYKGKKKLDKNIIKNEKVGTYYIKYGDDILYKKDIISPEDVKFDLIFFIKENIILVSLFILFTILEIICIFRIVKK